MESATNFSNFGIVPVIELLPGQDAETFIKSLASQGVMDSKIEYFKVG